MINYRTLFQLPRKKLCAVQGYSLIKTENLIIERYFQLKRNENNDKYVNIIKENNV